MAEVSSGVFSLGAEEVMILRHWTENEDEYVFFHSIQVEVLCFQHLQNVRKLIRIEKNGIYDTFFGYGILDESYSSLLFKINYRKSHQFDFKIKLSYLSQQLRTKSLKKKLLKPAYPFTLVKFRKWKDAETAEIAQTKYKFDEEMTSFHKLRVRLRSVAEIGRVKNHEFKVMSYVSGPAQKIYKEYNCAI